jgi:hypothetical protein
MVTKKALSLGEEALGISRTPVVTPSLVALGEVDCDECVKC